jgi:hypothetical protein
MQGSRLAEHFHAAAVLVAMATGNATRMLGWEGPGGDQPDRAR